MIPDRGRSGASGRAASSGGWRGGAVLQCSDQRLRQPARRLAKNHARSSTCGILSGKVVSARELWLRPVDSSLSWRRIHGDKSDLLITPELSPRSLKAWAIGTSVRGSSTGLLSALSLRLWCDSLAQRVEGRSGRRPRSRQFSMRRRARRPGARRACREEVGRR